ncbi:cytochrome P450 monooxygenase [Tricharina praecox]|uniref:cytochrome P450 monooxygenase n=1 Tax=Tricharina praecox TaxID=43433 RepID=UPI002220A4E6|nr:cytochrome P450 monooxygenase [Tricharina praecox]KAI5858931.1 cytochrome P450 monooxygenase [Tricharina praecox]
MALLLPALLLIPVFLLLVYRHRTKPSIIPLLHPLSAFTSLPILLPTLFGRRNATIHRAHLQHGSIVRLSPTEVSFSAPSVLSTIYTSSPKPPWYRVFHNYGIASMFATPLGREHAAKRKILAGAYSNGAVLKNPVIKRVASEVLPVLLGEFSAAREKEVEVWMTFNRLTMDFVTAFLLTRELGSRFLEGEDMKILRLYHSRRGYFGVSSELPWLARWIIPQRINDANDRIEAWCRLLCDRRRRGEGGTEECIFDRLTSAAELSEMQAASEILDHIGAGHETTALALSFALAALSGQPLLQKQLRESLESLVEVRDGWKLPRADGDGLEDQPLLNAIIKETLRLYAPIPGSQPRVVIRDMEILGHFVPAGTVISAQAYSLHRDPAIWKDMERFMPERWLEGDTTEMERAWWPFGSGGRGCIGRNLAMWEMRMVLAAIYANFETESSSSTEGVDTYTTAPIEGRVEVVFRRA